MFHGVIFLNYESDCNVKPGFHLIVPIPSRFKYWFTRSGRSYGNTARTIANDGDDWDGRVCFGYNRVLSGRLGTIVYDLKRVYGNVRRHTYIHTYIHTNFIDAP